MTKDLAERLREATRSAHRQVEQSGFMRAFLRGQFDRPAYCTFLRNLHEIYAAMEAALDDNCGNPSLARIDLPGIRRTSTLRDDLIELHGDGWPDQIAPTHAAADYAAHLHTLGATQPALLAAHAYVRYLGDLNGGRVLKRIVAETLQLSSGTGLHFYDFGAADATELGRRFRDGLNAPGLAPATAEDIIEQALDGFSRHAAMFEELAPLVGGGRNNESPTYLPRL